MTATPALHAHRINEVSELADEGWDGVFSYLNMAHAVCCTVSSSIGEKEGFDNLNSELQRQTLKSVETLIALASFNAKTQHDADMTHRHAASEGAA